MLDTVKSLSDKLHESQHRLDRLYRYAAGTAPLVFATERMRAAFDGRLSGLSASYCALAVQAVAERLQVVGIRLAGQEAADQDAQQIWQRNDLDEGSALAHVDALTLGRSYVAVWADDQGKARITVESPRQVYVAHQPGNRSRTAAIKQWTEGNRAFTTLYLPTEIHRFESRTTPGTIPVAWEQRGEIIPNALGVVPIIPIINRARVLDLEGVSELEAIIPLQDLLNRLLADLVIAALCRHRGYADPPAAVSRAA